MTAPEAEPAAYRPEDYDNGTFSTEPFEPRIVEKPWGQEKHLVPQGLAYMLKEITVNPGCRLSLQSHDVKRESWRALSGPCKVILENSGRELVTIDLEPGMTYTCALGQRHRLAAGEEGPAVFLEVSTDEAGNTFRLEDDYARPDETPKQRAIERGEA